MWGGKQYWWPVWMNHNTKCMRPSSSSINAVHDSLNHDVHQNKGHNCYNAKKRRKEKKNSNHWSVQSPGVSCKADKCELLRKPWLRKTGWKESIKMGRFSFVAS